MSRTGSVRHIHQYYRRENGLWHCSGYEECTHYVPRNMPPPVGRKSICWGPCAQSFQLTPANMVPDKPMCDACSDNMDILERYLDEKVPIIKKTGLDVFKDPLKELHRRAELNRLAREDKPESEET